MTNLQGQLAKRSELGTRAANDNKVISLNKWRLEKEKGIEFQRYQNYLSILHHLDLINEVKFIVNQINSNEIDLATINNAKLLLGELGNRLKSSSNEMAQAIELMIENLEKLIDNTEL